MSNDSSEFSAKNVDDAIAEGLKQLGLRRDQVDIEVINKGSRGILGFGGEPASIRITPAMPAVEVEAETAVVDEAAPAIEMPVEDIPEPAAETPMSSDESENLEASEVVEVAEIIETIESDDSDKTDEELDDIDREMMGLAQDLLARMMDLMGFDVDIIATWVTPADGEDATYLNLDIQGEDLGVLIGRRGETLANIQFLLRLMVNQQMKEWTNITVDVEQYKERRVQQLTQLANRMAEQVATGGRAMALEPMPANERRIVHIALRDHPAVYTESAGEGERRKVNIVPRE